MNTIKRILVVVVFLFANGVTMACEVCKKQQPKVLRGITHGAGPQSDWDYVVVWGMVIVVMISFFYAMKFILRPGERGSEHIKRNIFNLD
jgi:hypothetical protein